MATVKPIIATVAETPIPYYWDDRAAAASNLRLYNPTSGWRQFDDVVEEGGAISKPGSQREIESSLINALSASNLLVLTGAGSSFCAVNGPGDLKAPGMVDLWLAVEAKVSSAKMEEVVALIPRAKSIGTNIEKLMTLSKIYVSLFDDENSKMVQDFINHAENAILQRVDFVTGKTSLSAHRALIRKLARRGSRKPRTKIFTTNYDLCFEYAAQALRFVVVDGFSHSMPQVYDRGHFSHDTVRRDGSSEAPDYIENVFQFYKLHGSLDWRRRDGQIVRSRDAEGEPVLIYPRDTKYQEAFEAPYLDMMGAFQTALREPDTALIVSGFGFNDSHLCRPIMAAIEANMSLRVVICDVAFVRDEELADEPYSVAKDAPMRTSNPYFQQLRALADFGDPRITLLSGRFEDLAIGIPDLVAQTERERHAERLNMAFQPWAGSQA